jgi:hypothetical protein
MGCKAPHANPNGIASCSPALARFGEGLRWVATRKATTLKGLDLIHQDLIFNPFRVVTIVWDDPGLALRHRANPGLHVSIPSGLEDDSLPPFQPWIWCGANVSLTHKAGRHGSLIHLSSFI